jgi:transglycosylase-like protein
VRKVIAAALVSVAALIPALALAADASETDADALEGARRAPATQTDAVTSVARSKARALNAIADRREARRRKARERREAARAQAAVSPALEAIASCESGGNPQAIGGGGAYRGKYQFDSGTWASVGGSGDPAAASEAEQDRRAAVLYARAGATPWPVCGQ